MRVRVFVFSACIVSCSVFHDSRSDSENHNGPATVVSSGPDVAIASSRHTPTVVPNESFSAQTTAQPANSAVPTGSSSLHRHGMWVWEFDQRAPSAEQTAKEFEAWGVKRVFIKSGNGNESNRWSKNARADSLKQFVQRGIEVWTFAYFYPDNQPDSKGTHWGTLDDQISVVLKNSLGEGVSGLVVDAEAEFEGRPTEARHLCTQLRQKMPATKKLAYTSFGWLSRHTRFPYREMDESCSDAFLPQVYWAFGWPGGLRESLERLSIDVKKLGLKAPVWPIASNEPDPPVEQLTQFLLLAGPNASVFHTFPSNSSQHTHLSLIQWDGK